MNAEYTNYYIKTKNRLSKYAVTKNWVRTKKIGHIKRAVPFPEQPFLYLCGKTVINE